MSLLKNELSNYPVIFVKKDLRHWTSWKNWLVYGSLLEKRSITIRPLWRLFHVQCGLTCTPWTPMCVNSKWEVPIWTKKEWCSHRPNSGLWTRMSIWVSSALDCSVLGWRCWQLQHCCQIQHFVNNQKIIISDKFLVVYKMFDLATMLQL